MIDIDVAQRLGSFSLHVAFAVDVPVVGLFGRSGAGKSSLVNAIAGVTRPQRGHIRINDITLFDSERDIDVPASKRRIGYVFQDALLFPHLSVERNLLYGQRLRGEDERFIAPEPVIDVLGLAPLLTRKPRNLSGGERQRVAIGRALLAQPRILLLDEPLASLDVPRRIEILDYIERLRDRFHVPIIYVSHSMPEITRLADVAVVLAAGTCVAVGSVQSVMAEPYVFPPAERAEPGAIIDAVVAAHDPADQLTTLVFDGGALTVPRVEAAIGERIRVHVRARDVSLALERPTGLSILNILRGRVIAIREKDGAAVDVQVAVGAATLLASITRRSLATLGIRERQQVHALVKAVSFDYASTGYA